MPRHLEGNSALKKRPVRGSGSGSGSGSGFDNDQDSASIQPGPTTSSQALDEENDQNARMYAEARVFLILTAISLVGSFFAAGGPQHLHMIPFRIAFLCTCTGRVHEPPCFSRDSREGRASRTPVPVGESIIRQVASGKWQVQELLKAKFTADSPCTTQQKILRSAFSREGGGGDLRTDFCLGRGKEPEPEGFPPEELRKEASGILKGTTWEEGKEGSTSARAPRQPGSVLSGWRHPTTTPSLATSPHLGCWLVILLCTVPVLCLCFSCVLF